jgi:O-antigen/teichoic acid export membrane protein
LGINLILILYLRTDYGNAGIALARVSGYTAMFFSVFYVERWFFGKIQFKFWMKLTLQIGAAAILSIFFQTYVTENYELNWISLLASISGGGITYCLTLFLLRFLSIEEKLMLKDLLTLKKIKTK